MKDRLTLPRLGKTDGADFVLPEGADIGIHGLL
jgi:hypothetical protein